MQQGQAVLGRVAAWKRQVDQLGGGQHAVVMEQPA
jgi:hypothetical protein